MAQTKAEALAEELYKTRQAETLRKAREIYRQQAELTSSHAYAIGLATKADQLRAQRIMEMLRDLFGDEPFRNIFTTV